MRIDHLKRWHWALIGLAIGLAFSMYRGWVGNEGALIDRSTLEPSDFEKLLIATSPTSGKPMVRDVRYFGKEDGTAWLTAQQLVRKGNSARVGEEVYIPVKIPAKTPYVPAINPPAKVDPNFTVVDYLKEVRAKNPQVRFSTRWWDQEPVRTPMFALIGMALLAGAWPPLMHLLVGAGAGRDEGKKDPEYDLSRFGKGGAEADKPTKRGPTEAELAHLRELEAELEQRLTAGRDGTAASVADSPSGSPASQQPQPPQEIRKLDGGPLETTADNKPKAHKKFGGEFYPTETHVKQDEKP